MQFTACTVIIVGTVPSGLQAALDEINQKLTAQAATLGGIVAKLEDFEIVIASINSATNAIADKITALQGQIQNAGLDAGTESDVLAKLNTIAANLQAIGADPTNPVPDPVPDPAPVA